MSEAVKVREKKTAYSLAFMFTLMGAIFTILSPIYFGFVFSVIFIVPIYMGLNGLKGRRKVGFLIAMGIAPLAFGISLLWIRYFLGIIGDYTGQILKISEEFSIPSNVVKFVTIGGGILSIVLLLLTTVTVFMLIKYRHIFQSRK